MVLTVRQRVGDVEVNYIIEGTYEEVYAAYLDIVHDNVINNEEVNYEQAD